MDASYSKKEYLERLARKWPEKRHKYNYEQIPRGFSSSCILTIDCPEHGVFQQRASNHLYTLYACPGCSIVQRRKTTGSRFIERMREQYDDRFTYEKTIFTNIKSNVTVTCKIHGDITSIAGNFLRGTGCGYCSGWLIDRPTFIKRSQQIHGGKYCYDKVNFTNSTTAVEIVCSVHGSFGRNQTRIFHLEQDVLDVKNLREKEPFEQF